ncbi:MAG: P-II family nitrogen regulator [Treponema sp.]|nr:P-II family nitrogen regulator [Treponema sp.]
MKEVTIILRPKMYFKTKDALDKAGFSSLSVQEVIGRGKSPVQYDFDNEVVTHRLVAKRMITMFVRDQDVDFLVKTIVETNKTNHAGDGKIFVSPVEDGIRIRTGESGNEAIL